MKQMFMDSIKLYSKWLITSIIIVIVSQAYAEYNWAANPYFGAEYKLSYTKGEHSWRKMLPTNRFNNNGTLFSGMRFYDFLFSEIGYTKSKKYIKSSDVSRSIMFNSIASIGSAQTITLSYSNWYLDFNLQYPSGNSFAVLANLGVSSNKPKLQIVGTGNIINNICISKIEGKGKLIPHIGLGMQYIRGMFGIRTKISWENTKRARVNTGLSNIIYPYIQTKPFKSTYAWTLGAFLIVD